MQFAKNKVDQLNAWHSKTEELQVDEFTRTTDSIHFYDSIVVFERGKRTKPEHRVTGQRDVPEVPRPLALRLRLTSCSGMDARSGGYRTTLYPTRTPEGEHHARRAPHRRRHDHHPGRRPAAQGDADGTDGGDADGTDGGDADGTDGGDADGTDADGTDGDATDSTDGDAS